VKFRSFNEAKQFVQILDVKNQYGEREYCRSGKKPEDIPAADQGKFYKKMNGMEWNGIEGEIGLVVGVYHHKIGTIVRSFEGAKNLYMNLT
jgi:hypothetical protein